MNIQASRQRRWRRGAGGTVWLSLTLIIADYIRANGSAFAGVAVFADYTTQPDAWQIYRRNRPCPDLLGHHAA